VQNDGAPGHECGQATASYHTENVEIDETLIGIIDNLKIVDNDILMSDTLIIVALFNGGLIVDSDNINVLFVECGFKKFLDSKSFFHKYYLSFFGTIIIPYFE
jgi:hypothetical protein